MTLSQLVSRIQRHFPGCDFLVDPPVKGSRGGQDIAAWFDVFVYTKHGRIHVDGAPTPAAAWAEVERQANLKPAPLDAFDVESSLALRERRRA